MNKQTLRALIRQRKQQFSAARLQQLSLAAEKLLLQFDLYKKAKTILLYNALLDEVNTNQLLNDAEDQLQKTVLLPTVVGNELKLKYFNGFESLHEGPFHILEPEGPVFQELQSIDLAIVPAMAYDSSGNRLGRGRGYYDRLLPQLNCPLIGLCFDFQIIDTVPTESHDIPVDYIATNKTIFLTGTSLQNRQP